MNTAQREMLRLLSDCAPGKGLIVPTPSSSVESVFNSCLAMGWAEEVTSGPIRVWKATLTGRSALRQFVVTRPQYLQLVQAEC